MVSSGIDSLLLLLLPHLPSMILWRRRCYQFLCVCTSLRPILLKCSRLPVLMTPLSLPFSFVCCDLSLVFYT
jgi:hypothetical protein